MLVVRSDRDIDLWPGSQAVGQRATLRVQTNLFLLQYGPAGAKTWQVRFKVRDQPQRAEFATWPAWPLARAQAFASALAAGPQVYKPDGPTYRGTAPHARTLGEVAEAYLADPWGAWMASRDFAKVEAVAAQLARLHRTHLWQTSIRRIGQAQVAGAVDHCRRAAGDTAAQALLRHIQAVLRYAIDRREIADAALVLALSPGPNLAFGAESNAAPSDADDGELLRLCSQVLRDARWARGSWQVKRALEAVAYTVQMPAEVQAMRWDDLDLARGLWRVPGLERFAHLHLPLDSVPLCTQMVQLLDGIERRSDYVFYSPRAKQDCLSRLALEAFLRRQLERAHQFSPMSWREGLCNWLNTAEAGRRLYDPDSLAFLLGPQSPIVPGAGLTPQRTRAMVQGWSDFLTHG